MKPQNMFRLFDERKCRVSKFMPMFAVGCFCFLALSILMISSADAQEKVSSLSQAKAISKATGRPIFAVAGRST
jgi:hypothetical protein